MFCFDNVFIYLQIKIYINMKKFYKIILIGLVFIINNQLNAANYYWRATPVNNLFTNVGNWETSPGGGLSPAVAPGISDDVFFPLASSISTIALNAGNCRDFSVGALGTFTFTGNITSLNGSLLCPNGNATFTLTGTTTFTGNGTHTINMGTSATKITGGTLLFLPVLLAF